ncbi:hypothetical protein N7G274_002789 [Stereocaulon virgatum]|uniref:Uncharacterized protein n=1 Tax=Stereocaulon virgatum TaxID=373712 RepID=A0ABR4AGV5_9LECA
MPRERPQLSITLPRNFVYHYTEGEEPKTPERETPIPTPQSPRPENAIRIKRRSRPSVNTIFPNDTASIASSDVPIPTIEAPISVAPMRPLFQQRVTEPVEGFLAPLLPRKFTTLPRTPEPQQQPSANGWQPFSHQDLGESLSRPMSTCSLLSDSSDDSNLSLMSSAGDGSCTSPESDAPDPFKFTTIKKMRSKQWAAALTNTQESNKNGLSSKTPIRVRWTPEMDKHLWSTYLIYLQDPTVTPFKMLPGTAPPLGVCHRVAREARRTWRGGKAAGRKASELLSLPTLGGLSEIDAGKAAEARRPGSPDTIRPNRSGSNTPTSSKNSKAPSWPKSGPSTRRRLRHLCKSKPNIAPHYQRLLQNRSPSPFSSSSPRVQSRSHSRLSEVSSPVQQNSSPFNTRSVQLSLTASTSASMQPNGPLAQLAAGGGTARQSNEWFNEPPVPWASPTAIPSDVVTGAGANEADNRTKTPRLGSPFGYHTWGPSQSRLRVRPSTSRVQSTGASTLGPYLRSPIRLHDTFPYPSDKKRRALHELEDELSPGGSSMQQELLDNVFSSAAESHHRRVRSRGFSLSDVHTANALENLFVPPHASAQMPTPETTSSPSRNDPTTPTQVQRLGSPFHGVAPRPSRSRHVTRASLGAYEPFSSIGETLNQSMDTSDPQTSAQK